ncbi:hypothetical protein ACW14Y_37730 [Kitasatospora sp. cg17-2]
MERQTRFAAERRAHHAETKAEALEAFQQARQQGPNWSAFAEHARKGGWRVNEVELLDRFSAKALACLTDPTAVRASRTTGVVITPAQSGRTTFSVSLVARALDAGYRLVVVFHGIHNNMRARTQLRLERGLRAGRFRATTSPEQPGPWFITSTDEDYVRAPLPRLAFEKADPSLPLFAPINLHSAVPRLAVMKQNVVILTRLLEDLQAAAAELSEVPALLVDLAPLTSGVALGRIRTLLDNVVELLPRAQLVRFEEVLRPSSSNQASLWGGTPDFVLLTHPRDRP